MIEAVTYFTRYFNWYDTEHYHSGIDFVTPQQAHDGQRKAIVEDRRAKAFSQRRRPREENQQKSGVQKNQEPRNNDQPALRSVINCSVRSLVKKRAARNLVAVGLRDLVAQPVSKVP